MKRRFRLNWPNPELEPRLAPALVASLTRDINTEGLGSVPYNFTAMNGIAYFTARDTMHGEELWRSDGTSSGTYLVRDIRSGPSGSMYLAPPINFNGLLVFPASDGSHFSEPWCSDGTNSGTRLLADINPVNASNVKEFFSLGDTLFFSARHNLYGRELWKTDGTSSGTVMVSDINPGTGNSYPYHYANVNGTLYFSAFHPDTGYELWKSDGTSSGTVLVADIFLGTLNSNPNDLVNRGGALYFRARDPVYGDELRTSDGTSSGTSLVVDIYAGSAGSSPNYLIEVNGTLFFGANDGIRGTELWKSDGTSDGTTLVREINNTILSSSPRAPLNYGGVLVFLANGTATGLELWRSDGTSAGTSLVHDINPGVESAFPNTENEFANINGTLYFSADSGAAGRELWKSNGTPTGTAMVRDLMPGPDFSSPTVPANCGGLLVFGANGLDASGGLGGAEVWRSNGTSAGTALVKDINLGTGGSNIGPPVNLNGILYFSAYDGFAGVELRRSDGTSTGTAIVRDIFPGKAWGRASNLFNANGTLLFAADNGSTGTELWKSDGTSSGTVLACDIRPGGSSYPNFFVNLGGLFLFQANDGTTGTELWCTDGTSAGTMLIRDARPGIGSSTPTQLYPFNDILYFAANDGTSGVELWRSDGTSSGTFLLADIHPGPAAGNPRYFANLNGKLYFQAGDANGTELWSSDGTSSGTSIVRDINPSGSANPLNLTNFNGSLLFRANDGSTGMELWTSDGTSSGTQLVTDILQGSGSSSPANAANANFGGLVAYNGFVYFNATNGFQSAELWRSDGTISGTELVCDIHAGPFQGYPFALTVFEGKLYFDAISNLGAELWTSDGTSSGTQLFKDIRPGSGWSRPIDFTVAGNVLFFQANDGITDNELWSLQNDTTLPVVASITSTSANGTYTTGQSINVTLNFSEPVTLAGGTLQVSLDTGGTVTILPFSGFSAAGTRVVQIWESSPDLTVTSLTLSGGATLKDASGNNAVLALPASNLGVNANLIVNPAGPTTATYTVNLGVPQRSRLTSIELSFTNPFSATLLNLPGNITLVRTTPNDGFQVDVTNGLIVTPTSGQVTNLTLTFSMASGPGIQNASLADGRWRLTISPLSYQSTLNDPNLRRLFGDVNNDGTVDGNDLAAFGVAFGQTLANSPFDFYNDGSVDALDFAHFGNRFGVTL